MPAWTKPLAKLLMTQVPSPPRSGFETTEAVGAGETRNAPIFANYKAVSFPGLVVAITGAWVGLQQLEVHWLASRWVPFTLCMLLGGGLTWLELSEDNVTPRPRKVFGALVGFCNCLVLFSAVIGASNIGGGKAPGAGGAVPRDQPAANRPGPAPSIPAPSPDAGQKP